MTTNTAADATIMTRVNMYWLSIIEVHNTLSSVCNANMPVAHHVVTHAEG